MTTELVNEGLHAYEVDLKGIAPIRGVSTAYVLAGNEEEAKVAAMRDSDPTEEEPGEVRLQTWKMYIGPPGACPCIVCAERRGEKPSEVSLSL